MVSLQGQLSPALKVGLLSTRFSCGCCQLFERKFKMVKIILLVGLLKLLDVSNNPFLCSGIYTSFIFVFGILSGNLFVPVLISSLIAFVLSSLYFLLLDRFQDSGLYWIILICGLGIGLV